MTLKELMAETHKKVEFFNTLTDVDIEMLTFIDEAVDQGKKPNLQKFVQTFKNDTRPIEDLLSDISKKYLDYVQDWKLGTNGVVIPTLEWYDPNFNKDTNPLVITGTQNGEIH
jgi:hypothetical protein|tara:strand:- start:2185 stop:2523 length:339 start_codon:yes stop_codon:yes gene_type:complete